MTFDPYCATEWRNRYSANQSSTAATANTSTMQTTDSTTDSDPTAFRTMAVIGVKVGKYVKNAATGDDGVVITKNAA